MKLPLSITAPLALTASLFSSALLFGQDTAPLPPATITVDVSLPGAHIPPTLYGAFFEDINRAGDGGLYAEMIQNRSFEDNTELIAWTPLESPGAETTLTLDRSAPLNPDNPTSLKLRIEKTGGGRVGIFNQGFKGVPAGKAPDSSPAWIKKFEDAQRRTTNGLAVLAGREYRLSLYARAPDFRGPVIVSLETQKGAPLAKQTITGVGPGWKKYEVVLKPGRTDTDARLVIAADQPGTLWLDMVSLFPKDTYQNRPGGLRSDLASMMAAMHPGLLRFPGGSFSEGHILADAWRWKETLGDVSARPGGWNIWGYRSTNGLGFHEYLQLAEDLGAEPLYVAHVGMAEKDFVPLDQLEPWIQDVLDAIEYANGPTTSPWGSRRAQAGHPAPFNLKYVEIGNENGMGYSWGGGTRRDYLPRYQAFRDRIKARYPDIVTIANIHTEPDAAADIVDEHYYENSNWFFQAASRYDTYDRSKPKIYVGEYACKKDGGGGNLLAALAEAAFLTGLERNADVVAMSSYAPLFTNPPWEKWKPDAIVFDPVRAYGTPGYYVQAMFAANRPDAVLPLTINRQPDASDDAVPKLFAVAGGKSGGEIILKLVNARRSPQPATIVLNGIRGVAPVASSLVMSGDNVQAENSFAEPVLIAPKAGTIALTGTSFTHILPACSITILRIKIVP